MTDSAEKDAGRPLPEGFTVECREADPARHCTVSCAFYRTGHGHCPPRDFPPERTCLCGSGEVPGRGGCSECR